VELQDLIMGEAVAAARRILAILPLLNRLMVAELRRDVGDDTTMPQFRVLGYLEKEPYTLSDIARLRHVSLQSAGELVQILVERGWIVRTPDPDDRRKNLLSLTEAGRERYHQARKSMLTRLLPLMENLNPDEMAAVQVALQALHRVLSGEVGEEAKEVDDTESVS
jgi:DNA-binding MarR family transcriptional regulator